MVDLKGTYRFNNCNDMKTIMPNMRDGVLSTEEPNALNSRVTNGNQVKKPNPLKTKYAAYYNTKRSDINASVFQNYLKTYHNVNSGVDIPFTAIVIKAVANWAKSKTPLSFNQRKVLFEECSESNVKKGTSQMCAPLLCLFFGCDLMVTEDKDVLQEIANGTVCKFPKLVLQQGAELEKIKNYDSWVHAVGTDNIEYIEVKWQDCDHFVGKF